MVHKFVTLGGLEMGSWGVLSPTVCLKKFASKLPRQIVNWFEVWTQNTCGKTLCCCQLVSCQLIHTGYVVRLACAQLTTTHECRVRDATCDAARAV